MCVCGCVCYANFINFIATRLSIFFPALVASLFCKSFLYIELGTFFSSSFLFITFHFSSGVPSHSYRERCEIVHCLLFFLLAWLGWVVGCFRLLSSLFFVLVVQYFEVEAKEFCMHLRTPMPSLMLLTGSFFFALDRRYRFKRRQCR